MAKRSITFEEALKKYNRANEQAVLEYSEKERENIITNFPLEAWPELPLGRYALGQGGKQDCFCWWLEFNSPNIGSIKGGSSQKHLIYRQNDGKWWFDRQTYNSEGEAWASIRLGFVAAFEQAKRGNWNLIDDIDAISSGAALRTKALYCYFPDEILPIFSIAHIVHFLRLLDHNVPATGSEVVRLNRVLLTILREKREFAGWSNIEIRQFLYSWSNPLSQSKIFKIAPGKDAEYWKECRDGGYICVGWDEMGDLRLYDSMQSCQQKFDEKYSTENSDLRKSNFKGLWALRDLEPGDLVVANHGKSRVLAVGEVVEPGYEWLEERSERKHVVKVKWDLSFQREINPQTSWGLLTIARVSQAMAAQILSGKWAEKKGGAISLEVDWPYSEIANSLMSKRQVILYGPPGTGKTYTARRFAVWWLLREMGADSPDVLSDLNVFDEAERKLSSGQIVHRCWWVVANPSFWNWDKLFTEKRVEFSRGKMERNYPLVRKGDLVIGYQSSPQKKIVALGRISREMFSQDGDISIEIEPVARIADGPTYDELVNDSILSESEPIRQGNRGTLFKLSEDEFDHLVVLLTTREPELKKYLVNEDGISPLTRLTFHASYSYEDFVEGYRPVQANGGTLALKMEDGIFKRICRTAQVNPDKNYLVLIDEINRANVAKVFGELITLLEKDKRGLSISLPQSREAFIIPKNVFVLGTMNTADRSIKLLDTALRRRFSFIELMPNSDLLAGAKIGTLTLTHFLDSLNKRIVENEGREKQIGHSFLMEDGEPITDPEEFARRFRQEILPLLQEYCYDDYRVLAKYIGDELVDERAQILNNDYLIGSDQLIMALEKTFAGEFSK